MTEPVVCASLVCFSPSRYTGKERDAESGNDYFGARYYASSMGRFMSAAAPPFNEPNPAGGRPRCGRRLFESESWPIVLRGLKPDLDLTGFFDTTKVVAGSTPHSRTLRRFGEIILSGTDPANSRISFGVRPLEMMLGRPRRPIRQPALPLSQTKTSQGSRSTQNAATSFKEGTRSNGKTKTSQL